MRKSEKVRAARKCKNKNKKKVRKSRTSRNIKKIWKDGNLNKSYIFYSKDELR